MSSATSLLTPSDITNEVDVAFNPAGDRRGGARNIGVGSWSGVCGWRVGL